MVGGEHQFYSQMSYGFTSLQQFSVISGRWKGKHERLCAMKRRLGSGRISPPARFEPATTWSEVGSANRSAHTNSPCDTEVLVYVDQSPGKTRNKDLYECIRHII